MLRLLYWGLFIIFVLPFIGIGFIISALISKNKHLNDEDEKSKYAYKKTRQQGLIVIAISGGFLLLSAAFYKL
jgi:large-conductance mechanosensitive channel